MTGIMGRMSAYTGRALKWDWAMNASTLDLRPAKYEMGPLDGCWAIYWELTGDDRMVRELESTTGPLPPR